MLAFIRFFYAFHIENRHTKRWNATKMRVRPAAHCRSPAPSGDPAARPRHQPYFSFLFLWRCNTGHSEVFQISGEWKALASMWTEKKKKTSITCATIWSSWISCRSYWSVLYQHFRDLIGLKDLFTVVLAAHLAALTSLWNTTTLDMCNTVLPSLPLSKLLHKSLFCKYHYYRKHYWPKGITES